MAKKRIKKTFLKLKQIIFMSCLGSLSLAIFSFAFHEQSFAEKQAVLLNPKITKAEIEEILKDPKVDPNQGNEKSYAPLHVQSEAGNLDALIALTSDPRINVNQGTKDGRTALHIAVMFDKYDSVDVLLASGKADPNQGNRRGDTPLHWAACFGRWSQIRFLVSIGNPNQKNKDKDDALAAATSCGNVDAVKGLLSEKKEILDHRSEVATLTDRKKIKFEKLKHSVKVYRPRLAEIKWAMDRATSRVREDINRNPIKEKQYHEIIKLLEDEIKKLELSAESESPTLGVNQSAI